MGIVVVCGFVGCVGDYFDFVVVLCVVDYGG